MIEAECASLWPGYRGGRLYIKENLVHELTL